jgi:hypothetical protein
LLLPIRSSTSMRYFLAHAIVNVFTLFALTHVCARYSLLKALTILLLAIRFATIAAFEVPLFIVSNRRLLLLESCYLGGVRDLAGR